MEEEKKLKRTKRFGGGPHNLGDPDDKSLRKVEKDVLISEKIRKKAREEKCVPQVEEFTKCCKATKFLMAFKCREQNRELISCLGKWFNDEAFREECVQEYLYERSEYRRTGIPVRRYKRV